MGAVYRAVDLQLQRDVAIKAIHSEKLVQPSTLQNFREEALTLASFSHPNIVHIFEVIEDYGPPMIVMEYIPGQSLDKALKLGALDRDRVVDTLISISEAVSYAHAHEIIHRDIKPSNIILSADGIPKLMDFGLAIRHDDSRDAAPDPASDDAGTLMATPAFMSPEHARGALKDFDERTDVFSLGATLYFALTGKPACLEIFKWATGSQAEWKITPPTQHDETIPRDLEAICMKSLQKSRYHRYATMSGMTEDLRAYRKGFPVSAQTYDAWEKVQRAIRYKKEVFLGAVVSALLIFIGIFTSIYIHHRVARDSLASELRMHVMSLANTAALMIDPDQVAAIREPKDKALSSCHQLVSTLKRVRLRNDRIEYIYVMRRSAQPGFAEFVVEDSNFDSLEELDENGNGRLEPEEKPVEVGQIYEETPRFPQLMHGFIEATADESVEQVDWWGVSLSGYAPIRDETGKAIAIVGVDVTSDEVALSFERIDRAYFCAVALSGLLSIGLVMLILIWVVGIWEKQNPALKHAHR